MKTAVAITVVALAATLAVAAQPPQPTPMNSIAERYVKLVSQNKKPYFTLKAANQQVIGNSEMYESEAARDHGIDSVMKNAPGAQVADLASA